MVDGNLSADSTLVIRLQTILQRVNRDKVGKDKISNTIFFPSNVFFSRDVSDEVTIAWRVFP